MTHALVNSINEAEFKTLVGNLNRGLAKEGHKIGHAKMSEILANALGFSHAKQAKDTLSQPKPARKILRQQTTFIDQVIAPAQNHLEAQFTFQDWTAGDGGENFDYNNRLPDAISEPEFTISLMKGQIPNSVQCIRIIEKRENPREIAIEMDGGHLKTFHYLPDCDEAQAITLNNGESIYIEQNSSTAYDPLECVKVTPFEPMTSVPPSHTAFKNHKLCEKDIWALEGCIKREIQDALKILAKTNPYENSSDIVKSFSRQSTSINYTDFMTRYFSDSDKNTTLMVSALLMISNRHDTFNRIPGHAFNLKLKNGSEKSVFIPLCLLAMDISISDITSTLWQGQIKSEDLARYKAKDYPFTFSNMIENNVFSMPYNYLGWIA